MAEEKDIAEGGVAPADEEGEDVEQGSEPEQVDADAQDELDLDLSKRFLCSDGACIGVIGSDGRCKVCGEPIADDERPAFEKAVGAAATADEASTPEAGDDSRADEGSEDEPSEEEESTEEPEVDGDGAEGAFDPSERRLCSDGACIGLIGANGRCKECGKPYEESDAE